MKNFTVNLSLEISVLGIDEMPPGAAVQMESICNDYSDGRYPLNVELLHRSAGELFETAIYLAIEAQLREKLGDAMVPGPSGSSTSAAGVQAEKLTRGLRVYATRETTVSITPTPERDD